MRPLPRCRQLPGTELTAATRIVAAALTALLASCTTGSRDTPSASSGEQSGALESEVAAPDVVGPHGVGHQTTTVPNPAEPPRELHVDIWYPTDTIAPPDEPHTAYPEFISAPRTSEIATDNAPPATGMYPLVIYSHGHAGTNTDTTYLTEALASHGFVVAAPNHTGNTTADILTGTTIPQHRNITNRPTDITAIIDTLTTTHPLHTTIDTDHIGIAGHSLGATTALTLATHPRTTGQQRDPRIDAIAAIAPGTNLLSDEQLATITTPTLAIGGTHDTTTPIFDNSTRLADIIPATRIDIAGAGHLSFTTTCTRPKTLPTKPTPAEQEVLNTINAACRPDLTDPQHVHQLTQRYTIAFFKTHLTGNTTYNHWLTPTEGATLDPA